MDRPFQKWLMEQAAAKLPPGRMLLHEIQRVLPGSDSNIYKKIRLETELKIEEAVMIARHFDLSLDRYVHREKRGRAMFDYPPLEQAARSPADFLRTLSGDMRHILAMPSPAVWYATNEVPVFHYMPHRNLVAFKLYIWSRINWHLPAYARAKFSPEDMYADHPEIEQHRQEICAFYARVPTREYWPLHILDHTLNQIRHCAQARFFARPELPGLLLAELRAMLHTNLEAAYRGNKSTGTEAGAAGAGAGFELFFNEIAYTNNIILVFTDDRPVALYTTLDNPNFIRSLDAEMCQKMEQWLGNIEQSSVQISHRGERQRHGLFEYVQSRIDALERELGVG